MPRQNSQDFRRNMEMSEKLTTWEDVEKEIYTPEEIAISDLHAELVCELIKARKEKRHID